MISGFDSENLVSVIFQVLILTSDNIGRENATDTDPPKVYLLHDQREALLEFKGRVVQSVPPAYEYLKDDKYLVKWLRGSAFNVDEATQNFMEELRWRDEIKLDQISEDLSNLGMIYSLNQFDSEGRPILHIPLESWDLRQAVVSGQGERFKRFVYKMFLDTDTKLRKLQQEGKHNITGFVAVVNMKGFNLIQHGCMRCVPLYTALTIAFEKHFPESIHKAVFVNTPTIFEFILTAMKAVMSKELKAVFEVYGGNRNTWDPSIKQMVIDAEDDYYDEY